MFERFAGNRTHIMGLKEAGPVDTVHLLGLDLECITFAQMHDSFDLWLDDRERPALRVPLINAAGSVAAVRDRSLLTCYRRAELRFIDSMPYTKFARMSSHKPVDRMYGPDVFQEVCRRAKDKPVRFFLLGGVPGAGDKMAAYAESNFPGVSVVGVVSPPFRPMTLEEDAELCQAIQAAQPDFVWVGLGAPKQDLWIDDHHTKLRGCILIGVGAAFDFFSGRVSQAPRWIQRSGFEWLYRLTKDFRRLWKRYTRDNLLFVMYFTQQLFGRRF